MREIERHVTGAFIFSQDKQILLGKSVPGGVYTESWLVPGGGIEPGETALEGVVREVMEEVGLDISGEVVGQLDGTSLGQSAKRDKETGEMELVSMTFHDFTVQLDRPAAEISLQPGDDMASARWHRLQDLHELPLAAGTSATLQRLGFLAITEEPPLQPGCAA